MPRTEVTVGSHAEAEARRKPFDRAGVPSTDTGDGDLPVSRLGIRLEIQRIKLRASARGAEDLQGQTQVNRNLDMLKSLATVSALALGLSFPGAAFAQSGLLSDWSPSDMKTALAAAGATVTKEGTLDSGAPYVGAVSTGGMKFVVYGTVCEGTPKRCQGANISASFTLGSDSEVDAREKKIDRSAVGVRNGGDSALEVSRYVIFDGGITRANLATNIEVFIEVAEDIWNGGGE